jgi:hypothetical protein
MRLALLSSLFEEVIVRVRRIEYVAYEGRNTQVGRIA